MTAKIIQFPRPRVEAKLQEAMDDLGIEVTGARLPQADFRVQPKGDGWLVSVATDASPFERDIALAKAVSEIFDAQEAEAKAK